jgi:hypothetical protein
VTRRLAEAGRTRRELLDHVVWSAAATRSLREANPQPSRRRREPASLARGELQCLPILRNRLTDPAARSAEPSTPRPLQQSASCPLITTAGWSTPAPSPACHPRVAHVDTVTSRRAGIRSRAGSSPSGRTEHLDLPLPPWFHSPIQSWTRGSNAGSADPQPRVPQRSATNRPIPAYIAASLSSANFPRRTTAEATGPGRRARSHAARAWNASTDGDAEEHRGAEQPSRFPKAESRPSQEAPRAGQQAGRAIRRALRRLQEAPRARPPPGPWSGVVVSNRAARAAAIPTAGAREPSAVPSRRLASRPPPPRSRQAINEDWAIRSREHLRRQSPISPRTTSASYLLKAPELGARRRRSGSSVSAQRSARRSRSSRMSRIGHSLVGPLPR